MESNPVFERMIELPYSALGAAGKVKMDGLLNLFQDAASSHCHRLGISGSDLATMDLKWVISRYQVEILEDLSLFSPLVLKTRRCPWKNLYELRRFSISDPKGKKLVRALGIWVMIKKTNAKPVRLPFHMPGQLMAVSSEPPDLWENDPHPYGYDYQTRFKIRYHDLDPNQHVNNSVYVKWALEALPAPYIFEYSPRCMVISFVKESFYPDNIISRIHIEPGVDHLTSFHSIIHARDKSRLATLTVQWRKHGSHVSF